MGPKKKEEPKPKTILLGRPGTRLKMGIVGLPNVGKSTFFNILSKKGIPAENRPFCTIDPNNADVNIPDERFEKLCQIHKPASMVPAQLQIRDIAGLVRGASTGEGLGNAFLAHIGEVDGVFHMCRVFEEQEITHIEGEVDPIRDLEIIITELIAKDLQNCNNLIGKYTPIVARGIDKSKKVELDHLIKVKECLEAGKQIRCSDWTNKEVDYLNTVQFITAKPAMFLVNMSEKDYIKKKNKWLPKLAAWIAEQTAEPMICFSAEFENNLIAMGPEGAADYQKEVKALSQVHKIINAGYSAINLIHYFTAGSDEVKCWTIQKGDTAPQAAGKIHTDFEKGFICADVIHYADFEELQSESKCREVGKLHQEGRPYVVQDGDIIHFKFNVSKGGKK